MKRPAPPIDTDIGSNADQLETALAEAMVPIALDPARSAQLRERLLQRARASRANDDRVINVRSDDVNWHSLAKGVRVKMLCKGARSRSVLVELDAGAALPRHAHHEHEECVVLRGEALLGDLRVCQGDYHIAPAGSRHGRVSSPGGALLYLRGTSIGSGVEVARDIITGWLPGSGDRPVTVRADEGDWLDVAPGVQTKHLWRDADVQSMLVRLQPDAGIAAHADRIDEECLMLDGEAFFGDTLLRSGEYQLAAAGTRRRHITTDVGALLFMHGSAGCLSQMSMGAVE